MQKFCSSCDDAWVECVGNAYASAVLWERLQRAIAQFSKQEAGA
jgi:hypothetical protein